MNPNRLIPLLVLLLMALPVVAAPAPKAGMVVDVRGAPRVVVDGAPQKLELLAYVPPKARIEVDAGASASISLYATKSVYRITGPAVVQVEANVVTPVSGNAPVAQSLAQKLVALAEPADRVHGAVRMRDVATELALVTPENDTVLLQAPTTFHWEATAPGPYAVTVADTTQTGSAPVSLSVPGNTWIPPGGPAWVPGHTYRWSVAAQGGTPVAATFTLASAEVASSLASIRPGPEASIEEWVLYATALQEQGIRDESREAWKHVARQRPDLAKARHLAR